MRLEGSIDAFSLPDIFALLSMTKKTGGLHLRRGDAHGVVWFTTGSLTGGASDVSRQFLVRRLIGAGLVGENELETAIDSAEAEDIGVARALQQAGAIDEGGLHEVASEHVVDTVFDLLRWPEGDFAFVIDEPNPDDVGVSRQVDDVITEARRRLEVWGGVAAAVPSPQTVLSIAPNPPADPQLSRDEWALLALVDGRRTVAEIVELCGRGDFVVVSVLADLVGRSLLSTDDVSGAAALSLRHALLAKLEGRQVVIPAQPGAVDDVVTDAGEEITDADDAEVGDDDEDDPVAAKAPLASVRRSSAAGAAGRAQVTPARSEPFMPPRQPDHPEQPLALASGGGTSAAPAAATYLERDPSVNKSLLLRLIAGVRGL